MLHSVPTHINSVSIHPSAQNVWKEGRRTHMPRSSIRKVNTRRNIQIELDTKSDRRAELDQPRYLAYSIVLVSIAEELEGEKER